MSKNKIHIFRSELPIPTHPIDEFNLQVAPTSKKYIAPFCKDVCPTDLDNVNNAYIFGLYTTEDVSSKRFHQTNVGRPYHRIIGLKSGMLPKNEYGEAATACWGMAELLPSDEEELEAKIIDLLLKNPALNYKNCPIICWVYQSLVPVVEQASKESDLSVVRHYGRHRT